MNFVHSWLFALPQGAVAVRCRDVAGRSRRLVISRTTDEYIAVTVPPGEVATFTEHQVDDLRDELRKAAYNAAGALLDATGDFPAAPNPHRVTMPCSDVVGRPRELVVLSSIGNPVTLVAPAGCAAVLWPYQIGNLRYRLKQARRITMQPASPIANADSVTV